MEQIVASLLSGIAGGGISFSVIFFISKKMIDLRLQKDIEKFKSYLSLDSKLTGERIILSLSNQFDIMKELWVKFLEIENICGSFNINNDVGKLSRTNLELEELFKKNEPYINKNLSDIIEEIIAISSAEEYSRTPEGSFKSLTILRSRLVSECRRIFFN